MDRKEFSQYRKRLQKTQKEMSQLLGTSLKAIHSYEQGWRTVPTHIERQLLFLVSMKNSARGPVKPCWEIKNCQPQDKDKCPAWEFQSGTLCWHINGTICEGSVQKDWREKMKICRSCEVFDSIMNQDNPKK